MRTATRSETAATQLLALIFALEEDLGQTLVCLYGLDEAALEALVEAAQLIDREGQEILHRGQPS